ncbi:hypothetical protein BC939DRAFT_293957 [Gamsiella multidivaricata]|uniref:uncharacterized protein n=1 Tax=Gamsiella multidivaricata TaxID=101098 RepID=UPI00222040A7|nr:uncharacterized protein BC939DRAFT_293957 [Gamsiella multidivaricata]KAI7818400.1 hypothetical protein BC939DRAFT_293957 [Gamsiella multidivaricata]
MIRLQIERSLLLLLSFHSSCYVLTLFYAFRVDLGLQFAFSLSTPPSPPATVVRNSCHTSSLLIPVSPVSLLSPSVNPTE